MSNITQEEALQAQGRGLGRGFVSQAATTLNDEGKTKRLFNRYVDQLGKRSSRKESVTTKVRGAFK
jgi:hypothetical protein